MSKTTVLIVEDEAIIAADLAAKLAQLEYQVIGIVARGTDAVQMARTLRPDLVLMDIRLKGPMDGIEAAEEIRRTCDLPVIFLTAHSDAATLARAKVSEPFGYLLKPFEEREVATAIELALYKHQSERQLREQREWLRVTLASIGDAVITCDEHGRTTYLNPVAEGLTGWGCEDAAERQIGEIFRLVHEVTREPAPDPVACVLDGGNVHPTGNHTALLTRNGRLVPIEQNAARILDAGQRVIGAVLVFRDVTETRRAQEALQAGNEELATANEELRAQSEELMRAREVAEAATRAKSLFLANMSHELRTPMTGVLGMLDIALMGNLDGEQRDCIEAARGAAHSMVRILNDILDITAIEAGKLSLEEKPFSLPGCLRKIHQVLLPAAGQKGLEFGIRLSEDLPEMVRGDQTRLSQVLTNLTGNAIKFTEKGSVALTVAPSGAQVGGRPVIVFTVSDTGIGIPEEKRDLLFRKFSQLDPSHSRSFGGAGLGLAISKEIAHRMGGVINLVSEPGKGSSFSLSVPLAPVERQAEPAAAQPERLSAEPRRHPGSGPRLLLVEDEPAIRTSLTKMLTLFGYRADCAEDGRRAVEMLEQASYDLVLMDVQMPVMDGFQATRAIREKESVTGRHLPIIAMTAHALREDRDNCLAAGMDDYVSKPIDFKATLRLIDKTLERQQAQRGTA